VNPPIIIRVKLATGWDAILVRLPPSEAALRQHILRASFQTKVWQNHLEYKSGKTTVHGILGDWNCLFHVDIGAVLHKT
jgi:hypothetical protein